MISVERNAADIDDAFLRGLTTCFPGAWSEANYRWYLGRPFRSRCPDKVTAHAGTSVVAGLGINYRQVRSTSGAVHDIGILTAAWTLPKYRGRGCYARLLDAAVEIGTNNGCAALIAFVVASNASAVGLRRVGARAVPTCYLFLAPGDSLRPPSRRAVVRSIRPGERGHSGSTDSRLAFHYLTADEWTAQFIRRPHRTTTFEVDDAIAVVEHVGNTDRLQFLSRARESNVDALLAMAIRAHSANRHFFSFTTDEELAKRAAAHGLQRQAGALLVLELKPEMGLQHVAGGLLASSPWHVQPGDRM